MTPNHVKRALRAGRAQFGTLLNFGDPLVAEAMASVGFDWLLVDTEHGPIDLATLATMFATITRYPVAPLVRVPALGEEHVKRVLDAGAWGVLAPNVRTREEAERLVAACKYPPAGGRSLGAGRFALSFRT
ncbi:MAG TPA: aldolase/citrate lyase family protein, partial [Calidithermus sp.]|nr:aldolase/citrate lyase family protein [Calidithermus sp.]